MPESYTDRPLLSADFDCALLLPTSQHRRQLREGPDTPRVAHLLAVTSLVLKMGGGQTEAIGALLHDAVEDRGGQEMLEKIVGSMLPATVTTAQCGPKDSGRS